MLTQALESQFGPSAFDCPKPDLFKLVQIGSIHHYYVEFTTLANRTYDVNPDAILDCFLGGLKPELRREVSAQNPLNLIRAFSLVKLFEDKYEYRTKPTTWLTRTYYSPKPLTTPNYSNTSPHPKPPPLLPLAPPKVNPQQ